MFVGEVWEVEKVVGVGEFRYVIETLPLAADEKLEYVTDVALDTQEEPAPAPS